MTTTDRPRPDALYTADDWWASGWTTVLPRQDLALQMLVSTATVLDLDGTLDDILDATLGGPWDMLMDDLDSPLRWAWKDDNDDDPEQTALNERTRRWFETGVTGAGLPLPATVRELADLLAAVGVFTHTTTTDGRERWRMVQPLPDPTEVLALPPADAQHIRHRRWRSAATHAAQDIIRHVKALTDPPPTEVRTTVDRLAAATGRERDEIRDGLAALILDGDFQVHRPGGPADPDRLAGHAVFTLRVDWDLFHETRFEIHRADRNEYRQP